MRLTEKNRIKSIQTEYENKKVNKSVWRMPWLLEAKKDVTSCEKLRGGANNLSSADIRMGQPIPTCRDIP